MRKSGKIELNYKGFIIHRRQDDGLVLLTDMWRAGGSVISQEIDRWLNLEDTCRLLLQLVLEAKPDSKPIVYGVLEAKPTVSTKKTYRDWTRQIKQLAIDAGLMVIKRSSHGGTYAIDKIAIAYAGFLSPEFHSWALTAIKERIEEEADPELGIRRSRQRAVKTWERQGKSAEYISARLDSIPREDYYESALSEHGVQNPKDFAWCKFKLYEPIIGDTRKFRVARGLKKGQNCKDGMNIEELATTDFAKILSAKRINALNPNGATSCANISHAAAQQVAHLLNQ